MPENSSFLSSRVSSARRCSLAAKSFSNSKVASGDTVLELMEESTSSASFPASVTDSGAFLPKREATADQISGIFGRRLKPKPISGAIITYLPSRVQLFPALEYLPEYTKGNL